MTTETTEKRIGIVTHFNAAKGYGFIREMVRSPDGHCTPINDRNIPDIFVHVSQLRNSGLTALDERDIVRFEEAIDRRTNKPWATNIEITA